jgi:hypothetical protein
MKSDGDILKGFLRGDADAYRELLTRLRPTCQAILIKDHLKLLHAHDEILDAIETTLLEWRQKHLAGDERFDLDQSLSTLAWRLTKQEAKHEGRFWKRHVVKAKMKKVMKHLSVRSDADDSVQLGDLEDEIAALPEDLAATLVAEAQRVMNHGPTLEELFGITPAAARKRLERARRALKLRLFDEDDSGP